MSVVAKRVADINEAEAPGSFEFYGDSARVIAGMCYVCPCGCRRQGVLEFRPSPIRQDAWEWDGNEDRPTLSPSVHDMPRGVTHWHGWLRAGIWQSC